MDVKPLLHPFGIVVSPARRRALLAALALSLTCLSASAATGDISKFPVNDDNPSASIPSPEERNASPMQFGYFLQDLYTKGELAFEKKDWATSVKYFEAIAKVITDRARTFSKLCEAYQHLDKVALARANCARAIVLAGSTWIDHRRFVELSLAAPSLTPGDIADVDASILHVRQQFAALPAEEGRPLERKEADRSAASRALFMREFAGLACRFALRLRDANRLDRCVDELEKQKAEPATILTFEWTKAVVVRDRSRSLALIDQAKELKLPATTLAAMVREHDDTFGFLALLKRNKVVLGVALALMIIVGGALVWARRWRRSAPPTSRSATDGEPARS